MLFLHMYFYLLSLCAWLNQCCIWNRRHWFHCLLLAGALSMLNQHWKYKLLPLVCERSISLHCHSVALCSLVCYAILLTIPVKCAKNIILWVPNSISPQFWGEPTGELHGSTGHVVHKMVVEDLCYNKCRVRKKNKHRKEVRGQEGVL